ncbi:hypothetical protein [Shouchella tritolerans]|uniref:hypothetical protein n=1 Tax=Shouchella tritolerans TaxID=2979466 RepID=UPI0021E8D9BC|nr:hypothetical protein [Shouchella tritolerans]
MKNHCGTDIAYNPVAVFPFPTAPLAGPINRFRHLPDALALIKLSGTCSTLWGEGP